MMRARRVMASSGSMESEDIFLYPGIEAMTEMGTATDAGIPVSPGEGASEISLSAPLSLSFNFDEAMVRVASDSVS